MLLNSPSSREAACFWTERASCQSLFLEKKEYDSGEALSRLLRKPAESSVPTPHMLI
ncbi:MAG: hypothetical protein PHF18_09755 [Methanosarcina sp.]|uniref:hypothetical protein n=1 Tax=Methanosarcina sp. TaxID=2213 RepID=UPI00261842DC|nr:hypothetical protein [Methanosarcina sp.]MDD3247115.1 hypothetical protein [Methanosarcina sp.]MDD4248052.1 hypothetical protein [Methanosarcina sp.]